MKTNFILALDGSEHSMRSARYLANLFENRHDVSVTLLHVLAPVPPSLLEHGGVECPGMRPKEDARLSHKRECWIAAEEGVECYFFDAVYEIFQQAGFLDEQIRTKCVAATPETNISNEIIEECKNGGYDTVILGKHGQSLIHEFLIGTVAERVVRHTSNCTIWVVE